MLTLRTLSFTLRYAAVAVLYLMFSAPSRPRFDSSVLDRMYAKYPLMTVTEIERQIPNVDRLMDEGPQTLPVLLDAIRTLRSAAQRLEHEDYRIGRENVSRLRLAKSMLDRLHQNAGSHYHRRFGDKAMGDALSRYSPENPPVLLPSAEGEKSRQGFLLLFHYWLWSLWFTPAVLYLRCQQLQKSFWYEVQYRPHKLVGTWLFPLGLLAYPNDALYQHMVRSVRWALGLATSALSFLLTFGTWALAAGSAKAQAIGGKKSQPITWMLDYRRTDKVGGDGPGGLPNVVAVQVENAPRLPKRAVLQSLSAFGKAGYQTNEMVAYKAFTFKGLSFWPVAGLQFNTNRSVGVIYGMEAFFRKGHISVAAPNIWWERLVTPGRKDTFWAIVRPTVRLARGFSVYGEINVKKVFPNPSQTTLGAGGEYKTGPVRLRFLLLWKSTGEMFVRHQAAASGVMP